VKSRVALRSLLAGVALMAVLTGCGAAAPPAKELADEIIDTLEVDGVPVSDEVKACMHQEVAGFALTDEEAQGFENLDDVAKKADAGNEQAKQIMQRFEDALASCNP
jgi:aconitase B